MEQIRPEVRASLPRLLRSQSEPEDLELSPFNQLGGLGKAHQLFGDKLPELLEELNTILAA